MSLLRIVNQEKLFENNFLVSRFLITFAFTFSMRAMMAQLVEQRIRNAWVAGSSPARGSDRRD